MEPDQLPNVPNPIITTLIAAIITVVVLGGWYMYEGQHDFLIQARERNDVHGEMNLAWIKLAPIAVETYCHKEGVEACSTFNKATNTCYILSPDKRSLLGTIGHEFMKCVRNQRPTFATVPEYAKPIVMKYWFTVPWIIDDVCKHGALVACVIPLETETCR